ncbi:MAG: hypothetical protein P8X52_08535, partial [Limibacillus sp.]
MASDDGTLISLGQVIFAGGYEGGDGPLSSGHFELSFLDIGASGPGLGAQGLDPRLIPTHFSLKASMDKLPNDDILDFLSHFANTAALADAEEAPDLDPEATMMLADDLVNSLAASGSTFTIDELSFANKVSSSMVKVEPLAARLFTSSSASIMVAAGSGSGPSSASARTAVFAKCDRKSRMSSLGSLSMLAFKEKWVGMSRGSRPCAPSPGPLAPISRKD